jgi:hypothetical protein
VLKQVAEKVSTGQKSNASGGSKAIIVVAFRARLQSAVKIHNYEGFRVCLRLKARRAASPNVSPARKGWVIDPYDDDRAP